MLLVSTKLSFVQPKKILISSYFFHRESEDTILFMMKEIYTSMSIQTDSQIPQNTLTIERPSTSTSKTVMYPSVFASPDKFNKS